MYVCIYNILYIYIFIYAKYFHKCNNKAALAVLHFKKVELNSVLYALEKTVWSCLIN